MALDLERTERIATNNLVIMSTDEVDHLVNLMISHIVFKYRAPSTYRLIPPHYIIAIQRFLYHECKLSFNLFTFSYGEINPSSCLNKNEEASPIYSALQKLCESCWQQQQSTFGVATDPSSECLVEIVDFLERKCFIQFSYATGLFRPD